MRRTREAIALTITVLVGYELLRGLLMPEVTRAGGNLVVAGILYLLARWANATHEELGLSRWVTGLMVGMLALVAVSAVLALAALVPLTRNAFEEASVSPGIASVAGGGPRGHPARHRRGRGVRVPWKPLRPPPTRPLDGRRGDRIVVPVRAVARDPIDLECRDRGPEAALAASGLSQTTAMIVLATTAAGSVFCWLRLRSGSLLAPFLAHVGTNSVSTAIAWAVTGSTGTSNLHPRRRPRHPSRKPERGGQEPERGIEPLTSSLPWRRSAD